MITSYSLLRENIPQRDNISSTPRCRTFRRNLLSNIIVHICSHPRENKASTCQEYILCWPWLGSLCFELSARRSELETLPSWVLILRVRRWALSSRPSHPPNRLGLAEGDSRGASARSLPPPDGAYLVLWVGNRATAEWPPNWYRLYGHNVQRRPWGFLISIVL